MRLLKKAAVSALLAVLFLVPMEASAFLWFGGKKEAAPAVKSPASSKNKTLTLQQAYDLALKRSESVAIQGHMIDETRGRYYQAMSVILPTINFKMTHFEQDAPHKGEQESSSGDGATGNLSRRTTPQARFTFHQPLFSGFKEIAALGAGGADRKAHELRYQRAKELLWVDVSDSFYAVMQARQDASILTETSGIMGLRIQDLNERIKIGRSRLSEAQTSIGDQKLIEADLAGARRVEKTTRELFEFYIGRELEEGEELVDDPELPKQLSDPMYYLAKASVRSDVRAAEQEYILAQKKVVSAQSGFFPQIYLDGNYYTRRVGFQSGIDWDATLTMDVPIFDGMTTIGTVRETASQREEARLTWERARRWAALEAQQEFDSYVTGVDEEAALREARDAVKESYRLQSEDYKLNLVNNLEVLDSLRRYQDVYRSWNSSFFEAKKAYWALKAAAGDTGAENTGRPK